MHIGSYAIEHAYSCQYDYLSVAEGDGSDVRLCGEGSFEGFSVGTTMTLHFHSDCSVTHNGFTVEYSQIPGAYVYRQYLSPGPAKTSWYIAEDHCVWLAHSLMLTSLNHKGGCMLCYNGVDGVCNDVRT